MGRRGALGFFATSCGTIIDSIGAPVKRSADAAAKNANVQRSPSARVSTKTHVAPPRRKPAVRREDNCLMIEPQPGPMTLKEYDRLAPPEGERYELHGGYLVAFSTGTGTHGILCTRISTALDSHVRPPCHVFGAGAIGVRPADRSTNVIPDGVVICEQFDLSSTYIMSPKLVVEVISPESVNRDRVAKLDIYRAIPSIDEYLMVDSRRVWACVYRRAPGGAWLDVVYETLDARVDLLSVDFRIAMADLYRGIEPRKLRIRN